ncbi:MAG: hypothetical protein WD825_04260 [Gemmatimonadaceae bacterium]
MTLAIHAAAGPWTKRSRSHSARVGDAVTDLGKRYAAEMNASDFAIALRQRHLARRSYLAFIATMYPLVVGFNRALIRSIAKVDHVRNSTFVKTLAQQLEEEQAHNQLWRAMLEVFDIDHEALYNDIEEYFEAFSKDELDRHTRQVLLAVRRDLGAGADSRFPSAIFPDAILALCHYLWSSAADDSVSYWEHFASQAGIEMVIYDVVTHSILPGVLGHPELDRGVASTHWWMEHGQPPEPTAHRHTDEEKHLALSKMALNRSETANAVADAVESRAEDTMRLFAAALIGQRPHDHAFPIERYLKTRMAT